MSCNPRAGWHAFRCAPVVLVMIAALVLIAATVGCDSAEDRPLTLAERLAGSWALVAVNDGAVVVTQPFREAVGTVRLELQSAGCCAGGAGYRLTVTQPDGTVAETRDRYLANDVPTDGDDFIVLEKAGGSGVLVFAYDFDPAFGEMTLTGLGAADEQSETLAASGIDFTFRRQVVLVFDRVR